MWSFEVFFDVNMDKPGQIIEQTVDLMVIETPWLPCDVTTMIRYGPSILH